MNSWALIGMISGFVLGITGAGGTMVSVPLLMKLLGYSIHEATTFALYAVALGALLNCLLQYRDIRKRLSFSIALGSLPISLGAAWIKPYLSPWFIKGLFITVALSGLLLLIKPHLFKQKIKLPYGLKIAFSSFVIGSTSTLTGLGGGVLLSPILHAWFKLTLKRAIPTSLFAVFLTSIVSICFQNYTTPTTSTIDSIYIMQLALGTLLGAIIVKGLFKILGAKLSQRFRKTLLGLVIIGVFISFLF